MTEYRAVVEPAPEFLATLPEGTVIPAPEPGWPLEFQRTLTHLEVRQVRGAESMAWGQAIAFADLVEPPGAVPVFAIVDGAFAYRFGDSGPWGHLFALADLKGEWGLSEHEVWLEAGNFGTVLDFLASLKGDSLQLPAFVASSRVGVVGSVPTVAAEEVDGEVRFNFVLPPPRDGITPPPLNLSVTGSEVAQGQPMTATLSGWYPNLALALVLRAGAPGSTGPQGAGGTPNVDLVGTGVPNGSATAQPGTIYKDLAETYGVRLWIKDTGANNQGWVPLVGDTGIRDITSLQDPQFMTIATSKVIVQRFYNGNATLAARCSAPANPTGNFNPRIYLPTGFWPEPSLNTMPGEAVLGSARALASTAPTGFQWNWYIASGALRGFSTTAPIPMGGGFVAYATFACSQPAPTI